MLRSDINIVVGLGRAGAYAKKVIETLNPKYVKEEEARTYLQIRNRDVALMVHTDMERSYAEVFMEESGLFFEEGKDYDPATVEDVTEYTAQIILSRMEDGKERYSCPLLTVCWYLFRLGIFPYEEVDFILGKENFKPADVLVNVLPYHYLKIEGSAFDIMEYTTNKKIKKARRKIKYVFY